MEKMTALAETGSWPTLQRLRKLLGSKRSENCHTRRSNVRDRRRSERITRERVLSESRFGAEQPCSANSKARSVHSLLWTSSPYLARFQTSRAVPDPSDVIGVVHFSSPPEIVKGRFWSVPIQFGNVVPSMWTVKVLALLLTEYVPK